jgi:hypothetical protein
MKKRIGDILGLSSAVALITLFAFRIPADCGTLVIVGACQSLFFTPLVYFVVWKLPKLLKPLAAFDPMLALSVGVMMPALLYTIQRSTASLALHAILGPATKADQLPAVLISTWTWMTLLWLIFRVTNQVKQKQAAC